jgi:hypothetical protein
MHSLLTGDVSSRVAAVQQQGRALANPAVWDGPSAARFRGQEWPPAMRSLDRALQALESLQQSSETVIENINRAGTNGTVSQGGGGGTTLWESLLRGLEGIVVPPVGSGGIAVTLWSGRRALSAFGGIKNWMTKVHFGQFGPLDPAGVPVPWQDVAWWQRGLRSFDSANWVPKPGVADVHGTWDLAGKWGGRASGVLAIGLAAVSQWVQDSSNTHLDTTARVGRSAYAGLVTGGATWGGAIAGGEIGGAIGTAIFPGVGTVIGGLVGGLVGGAIGSGVGNFVVSHTVNAVGGAADWAGHELASLNPF